MAENFDEAPARGSITIGGVSVLVSAVNNDRKRKVVRSISVKNTGSNSNRVQLISNNGTAVEIGPDIRLNQDWSFSWEGHIVLSGTSDTLELDVQSAPVGGGVDFEIGYAETENEDV